MPDQLPPATFLRSLAKWMLQHGIGSQTDHERLVEIGNSLEWLPIESAPKDGTHILGAGLDGGTGPGWHQETMYWHAGNYWVGTSDEEEIQLAYIRFWRPLPTPPAKEG